MRGSRPATHQSMDESPRLLSRKYMLAPRALTPVRACHMHCRVGALYAGESGQALTDANRRLEELTGEHNTLRLKFKGVEEALSMAQQLLGSTERARDNFEAEAKRSGARAAELEAEITRCKDSLAKALEELKTKVKGRMRWTAHIPNKRPPPPGVHLYLWGPAR